MPKQCQWDWTNNDCWSVGCTLEDSHEAADYFNYCPFCGHEIIVVKEGLNANRNRM